MLLRDPDQRQERVRKAIRYVTSCWAGLLPSTGLTGASKRATMPPNGSSGLWPLEERVISLRRQRRVVRAKVPARTNTHPTSHDRDRVAVLNRESACVKQGRVTNEACLAQYALDDREAIFRYNERENR